jgi:hypothetical protein
MKGLSADANSRIAISTVGGNSPEENRKILDFFLTAIHNEGCTLAMVGGDFIAGELVGCDQCRVMLRCEPPGST